jgi:gamma-glutamyl:cysteine ligase YbdK (ATP-grasp superfamily)
MRPLHLFNAFGVEVEYMIVDADSLEVRPISDLLLTDEAGMLQGDVERSEITWSNELVLHVIELKSTRPVEDLHILQRSFHANVIRINALLKKYNAMLMPTAMHPFMDPYSQMRLWPHDFNEVYKSYDALFNCKGHGWANLQSTHLNLPFYGDEEFRNLHNAIRIVLPLLPALCASSPIFECKTSDYTDARLHFYKSNQSSIPSITGAVIPEIILSKLQYEAEIYNPIKKDIKRLGQQDILDPVWVNSRGAIPRFDRSSIEIRLMDVQECPAADIAIIFLVSETLKQIVIGNLITPEYAFFPTLELAAILDDTIRNGGEAVIKNKNYLSLFGITSEMTASQLWDLLFNKFRSDSIALRQYENPIRTILEKGNLSKRIIQRVGENFSINELIPVYRELCSCLGNNRLFIP